MYECIKGDNTRTLMADKKQAFYGLKVGEKINSINSEGDITTSCGLISFDNTEQTYIYSDTYGEQNLFDGRVTENKILIYEGTTIRSLLTGKELKAKVDHKTILIKGEEEKVPLNVVEKPKTDVVISYGFSYPEEVLILEEPYSFFAAPFYNCGININIKTCRGDPLPGRLSTSEYEALQTLREFITEKEYRRYLKYGFLIVKAKSGKFYQIFRNKWHTKVWYNGRLIEEVCVRINSLEKVPPTDNVIAFKIMIETNEDEFKKCGNVYNLKRKTA